MVYGGIDELQSRLFGSLTIELVGDDRAVDAAIAALREVTVVQELAGHELGAPGIGGRAREAVHA